VKCFPCLATFVWLSQSHGDNTSKLQGMQLIRLPKRSSTWRHLQAELLRLCDELQHFGEDVRITAQNTSLMDYPIEAQFIKDLAEQTLKFLTCQHFKAKHGSKVRLRLETFRSWVDTSEMKPLCVLVTQDGSHADCHELLVHGAEKKQ